MQFLPHPARLIDRIRQDPRSVFDLPPSAGRPEINTAFRRLVRAYHPDRSAPFLREANAEIVRALYSARETLLSELTS